MRDALQTMLFTSSFPKQKRGSFVQGKKRAFKMPFRYLEFFLLINFKAVMGSSFTRRIKNIKRRYEKDIQNKRNSRVQFIIQGL